MNTSNRPIISIVRREDGEAVEEPITVIDFFEILLPCRKFQIGYKVAERGAVSVTSEFLLRLLYSVDGMEELAIAEFFGFDAQELSFVMDEVTTRDYALRRDGRVWLTDTGRHLFRDGEDTPHILSVEKRSDVVGFDLLSLCPQEFEPITRFDLALPELIVTDTTVAEGATKRVHSSFHKHFSEIGLRRRGTISEAQQYLYSVDSVAPEQRFFSVVPVTVTAKGGRSSSAEVDLTHWRSGHELEDRDAVLGAVSNYIDGLKKHKHIQDAWAYNQLALLAPEFLDDFIRQDGLAVERFHKSAVARVGELRADRPTIPLVGSLFTPLNNEKIRLALDYAITRLATDDSRPDSINWLIPSGHWGFTRALPATLAALKRTMTTEGDLESVSPEIKCVAWRPSAEKYSRLIADNFGEIRTLKDDALPTFNLEILWIPGLIVAALVHAPIKSVYSLPVPLGILSFDPKVVARVQAIIGPTS
jgi:hypothetical protein